MSWYENTNGRRGKGCYVSSRYLIFSQCNIKKVVTLLLHIILVANHFLKNIVQCYSLSVSRKPWYSLFLFHFVLQPCPPAEKGLHLLSTRLMLCNHSTSFLP
ncbi:hypothetical protein GDO78_003704 [Eleutherodactylus coqui]|uniref:Uncharacterized protein n=1 Tax=Eleutherodactylus coqui TaxID=57060 RepID=A0A8J6EUK9_ELECQ|nr:hypothetical protein GDO78_003704 [Eleutherodactylus coqui]